MGWRASGCAKGPVEVVVFAIAMRVLLEDPIVSWQTSVCVVAGKGLERGGEGQRVQRSAWSWSRVEEEVVE